VGPAMTEEERAKKTAHLENSRTLGEQAYDDMYEKARSPSAATACYNNAKEAFYAAINAANELGLTDEARRLEARLQHIKAVFRNQFP